MARRVFGVVAAAGQGTRLGAQLPKAFVDLAGESLLQRSVGCLLGSGCVDHVVVVVSAEMEHLARGQLAGAQNVSFVHGGKERAESIFNGLRSLPDEDAVVLIHDAARCLTPQAVIRRVAEAAASAPAVIPVVAVADTIKKVDGDVVVDTPARASLRAVQTPQGFDLAALLKANEAYFAAERGGSFVPTDDASLMEWFGVPVVTVEGDPLAFKITTPLDMRLARTLLQVP
ncbi:2-C-methyl-D-erythritol 4-phosphate cytidylyltransferase [Corynebacterium mayonis]|uniref:2-C-methyl-D-erythritol 4-phosphate cytidylyltransferase n=1 Tax=Corynebacterium mayonis TaxID=3062461 RepID=UPI0031409FB7